MNQNTIGVIIPYYNGSHVIDNCIASLTSCKEIDFNIFIVDNSTVAKENEYILKYSDRCHIVSTQPGIGFGRACNLGYRAAVQKNCELIILLNQDTVVDSEFIAAMLDAHLAHPKSIIIPIIFNYQFQKIEEHFVKHYLYSADQYLTDLVLQNPLKDCYPIQEFSGACLGIPTSIITTESLFDPVFYMYGEDNDFNIRLQNQDRKSILAPKARIAHIHSVLNLPPRGKIQSILSRCILDLKYKEGFAKKIQTIVVFKLRLFLQTIKLLTKGKIKDIGNTFQYIFVELNRIFKLRKLDLNQRMSYYLSRDLNK